MGGVAQWVEDGIEFLRHVGVAGPDVGGGYHQIFGEGPVPVYAHALGVFAVFLMALQAVAALAAGDMPLAGNQVPGPEALHTGTHLHYFPHILVPGGKADGYGVLCPFVPLVDVHVRAADGCLFNLDLHVVGTEFRDEYTLHPKSCFRFFLDESPHHVVAHKNKPRFLIK